MKKMKKKQTMSRLVFLQSYFFSLDEACFSLENLFFSPCYKKIIIDQSKILLLRFAPSFVCSIF